MRSWWRCVALALLCALSACRRHHSHRAWADEPSQVCDEILDPIRDAAIAPCSDEDRATAAFAARMRPLEDARAACRRRFASAAADRIALVPDAIALCQVATRDASIVGHSVPLPIDYAECVGLVRGLQDEGQPCASLFECAPSLTCRSSICAQPATAGASCEPITIADGLSAAHGPCADGLTCLHDTCVPLSQVNGECELDVDCHSGLHCNVNHTCANAPAPSSIAPSGGQAGASCNSDDDCLGRCSGTGGQTGECVSMCGSG
jgi:hypothetical protein